MPMCNEHNIPIPVAAPVREMAEPDEWPRVEAALSNLPERERTVMGLRYCERPLTLEQIGAILRVSKERVRQLETKALRHMREALLVKEKD